MQAHGSNQRYAESAVLKKVLDTAIAPDLLDQLQSETNFTPATSEAKIQEIDTLLAVIYDMAAIKGSEHPDTLERLQELVNLYEETCQFSCAEKLLLRLQIAFQRTYGKENIMMSKVWNRLAEILMHEVHYPEAETYYLKSLALIEVYYPLPTQPPVHRHNSHRFSQQYKDAKAFHVASTVAAAATAAGSADGADGKVAFAADDDDDVGSKASSPTAGDAKRYESKGDDGDKSGPFSSSAKAVEAKTITSKVPFQSMAVASPRIDDASSAEAKAYAVTGSGTAAIIDNISGDPDPAEIDPTLRLYQMYIPVVRGLAEIYWHLQRLSDSERCYRRVLPMLFYWHGLQHEETLSAINGLALVLEADQRAAEALELCERSLQDCISLLGPKDPITQTAVSTVARLKETLGMFQEAEAMYRLAITYSTDALGETHPQSMGLSLSLARLLQRTHQYAASLIVLEALAPRYERLYGAYHLEYLEVVFMQGELCVFLDDYAQARRYYELCYTNRCLLLRTRHHPLVYQAKFAIGKTFHMACAWRQDIALFRTNVEQAKRLLTHAFYGTIAIYGNAPMTKPLLLLPAASSSSSSSLLVSSASSSSSSLNVASTDGPTANETSTVARPPSFQTSSSGGPRGAATGAATGVATGAAATGAAATGAAISSSSTPASPSPHPPGGTRMNSVRASLGMDSLLEADCDGHSIDRVYQLAGVFRVECLTMARYLGQFYLEYDYYGEADLLYALLLDVLRQQETRQPEMCRRLFTVDVQAEIHVAYGRVLETKKQYARAVTVLARASDLYQRWVLELTQNIDEGEAEVRRIRAELAHAMNVNDVTATQRRRRREEEEKEEPSDGDGALLSTTTTTTTTKTTTRLSPLEKTLKQMLVTSKEEQLRQWRVQLDEAQAAAEDCTEQHQYAMSLYSLSS